MTTTSQSGLDDFYNLSSECYPEYVTKILNSFDVNDLELKERERQELYEHALDIELGKFSLHARPHKIGFGMERIHFGIRLIFLWILLFPLFIAAIITALLLCVGVFRAVDHKQFETAISRYEYLAWLSELFIGPLGDIRAAKLCFGAWIYLVKGELELSIEMFHDAIDWSLDADRRVQEFGKESFGADPSHLVSALNGLSLALLRSNRIEEAETAVRDALDLLSDGTDVKTQDEVFARHNLGLVFQQSNDIEHAIVVLEEALDIAEADTETDETLVQAIVGNLQFVRKFEAQHRNNTDKTKVDEAELKEYSLTFPILKCQTRKFLPFLCVSPVLAEVA